MWIGRRRQRGGWGGVGDLEGRGGGGEGGGGRKGGWRREAGV